MTRQAFRLSDLYRAIRGVEARGLKVEAVEISVEGAIRVLTRRPPPGVALNDDDDDDWAGLAVLQ